MSDLAFGVSFPTAAMTGRRRRAHYAHPDRRGPTAFALNRIISDRPEGFAALGSLAANIGKHVRNYDAVRSVSAATTPNQRDNMYFTAGAMRLPPKLGVLLGHDEKRRLASTARA